MALPILMRSQTASMREVSKSYYTRSRRNSWTYLKASFKRTVEGRWLGFTRMHTARK